MSNVNYSSVTILGLALWVQGRDTANLAARKNSFEARSADV